MQKQNKLSKFDFDMGGGMGRVGPILESRSYAWFTFIIKCSCPMVPQTIPPQADNNSFLFTDVFSAEANLGCSCIWHINILYI